MTHQPQIDRFTLPGDIPDEPDDAVPPRHARGERHEGSDQAARGYELAHPAGRGWEVDDASGLVPHSSVRVERSRDTLGPSGLSTSLEANGQVEGASGLVPTPSPSRMREGSETSQAEGEASRSGVGQSLTDGDLVSPTPGAKPVPTFAERARPGPDPYLTPERQAQFCEHLSHNGNVRSACARVGVSTNSAYRARRRFPDFARLWDAAILLARAHAEQVLAERALEGVEESVFYHGEEVATRRRFDSRLLLAHLARLDRKVEDLAGEEAPAIGEGDFDSALAALEAGEDLPGMSPCELREEDCLACGSPAAEACRADQFTEEQLADRADPAHWIRGEYLSPWFRRVEAMEQARPVDAPPYSALRPYDEVEEAQVRAFEAGEAEWWLRGTDEDEEENAAEEFSDQDSVSGVRG